MTMMWCLLQSSRMVTPSSTRAAISFLGKRPIHLLKLQRRSSGASDSGCRSRSGSTDRCSPKRKPLPFDLTVRLGASRVPKGCVELPTSTAEKNLNKACHEHGQTAAAAAAAPCSCGRSHRTLPSVRRPP